MRYISLDIETTGLDPDRHQVLQMAMVVDEWPHLDETRSVNNLLTFEGVVAHDEIMGQPVALAMNAEIIDAIAKARKRGLSFDGIVDEPTIPLRGRDVPVFETMEGMCLAALKFLMDNVPRPWVVAGKNVAGFDLRFLHPNLTREFHHRVIDVGSIALGAMPQLWVQGDKVPSLQELAVGVIEHDALADAREVVEQVRLKMEKSHGLG